MAISAGERFGHYEILSLLGKGGMGEVWRARDTRLDRDVAIKLLPAEFAQNTDRLRRFEQEARATSALNHPNILTIYDIGTSDVDGSAPFIVMELLEGEELRASDCFGPSGGARQRHRPPRPEAGEFVRYHRRSSEDSGFWFGQAATATERSG